MKHSVCKNLFKEIDAERNVQIYYKENVYRCKITLQKSLIKLWLKNIFKINVQRDENNVQIKTIQNKCIRKWK